ncbi:MAG: hypothetical protein CSA62_08255 [Planctomycetota bacterium]|nr:MAG: hypothetical protein CSA62_08255 [Planctomycetota bacterium]
MGGSSWLRAVFYLLVGLCLAQLTWWTYFAYQSSGDLERLDLSWLESRAFRAAHALEGSDYGKLSLKQRSEAIEGYLEEQYPKLQVKQIAGPIPSDSPVIRGFDAGNGKRFVIQAKQSALDEALAQGERTRRMFVYESIAFVVVVLAGVVMIRVLTNREAKISAQQQRFLTGATHELKTPLATLRLGLQSMEQGSLPKGKLPHYAAQMVEQVNRLEMEVENLLRSAAGTSPAEISIGDLGQDAEEVAREFSQRFGAYDLELDLQRREALALPVQRDRNAIRQILRNLLDNACKFSPRGGRIALHIDSKDGQARVQVIDAGPGVLTSEQEKIFERFYRGSSEAEQSKGGTGLGLWLSRKMARAQGGELSLIPSQEGACFELRLPLAKKEALRT